MISRSRLVLGMLLLSTLLAQAATQEYTFDQKHSNIGFNVRHMMVTNVPGKFTQYSGKVVLDDEDHSRSQVNFVIQAASIDTGDAGRDKHLRSADFFDVEKFPEIRFVSKRIEKRGDGYVAIGDLTMKDVTKTIELPFTLIGPVTDQRGNKRYGVEARTKLNRQDYNVAYSRLLEGGGLVVANDVNVLLDLQLVPAAPPASAAR